MKILGFISFSVAMLHEVPFFKYFVPNTRKTISKDLKHKISQFLIRYKLIGIM